MSAPADPCVSLDGARSPYACAELSVQAVRSVAELRLLAADYARLDRAARNTSPFALHEWHTAWSSHFLNLDPHIEDRLSILVLRNRDAACVAIVPLVFSRRAFGPLKIVSVDLLGADPSTTEARAPLVESGYEHLVVKTVRRWLATQPDWDWISWGGLCGGFGDALAASGGLRFQPEAPGYVLDLAPTWERFRRGLKRNIRESLRHCYNSLKRDGHRLVFRVVREPAAVRRRLDRFFELHELRANMPGTVAHPNHFATEVSRRFLYDVCDGLAQRDAVRLFELCVDGEIVAMRLGFVVGDSLYLYYSGYDPRWATYSVMTTTVAEALKYAIAEGLKTVNLSRGTDASKTRWGPRVVNFTGAVERRDRLTSLIAHRVYLRARSASGLPSWILRPLGRARRVWS